MFVVFWASPRISPTTSQAPCRSRTSITCLQNRAFTIKVKGAKRERCYLKVASYTNVPVTVSTLGGSVIFFFDIILVSESHPNRGFSTLLSLGLTFQSFVSPLGFPFPIRLPSTQDVSPLECQILLV